MFKEINRTGCTECDGKGYVQGTLNRATCIFCNGQAHTNHGSRFHSKNLTTIFKWCEDYLDGKKEGWYH